MTDDKEARARKCLAQEYDRRSSHGLASAVRCEKAADWEIKAMLAFAADEVAAEWRKVDELIAAFDKAREANPGVWQGFVSTRLEKALTAIRAPEAAKPAPQTDGWIEWHGGDNPLAHDPEAVVNVKTSSGEGYVLFARHVPWGYTKIDAPWEIASYRIVSAKPKNPLGEPIGGTFHEDGTTTIHYGTPAKPKGGERIGCGICYGGGYYVVNGRDVQCAECEGTGVAPEPFPTQAEAVDTTLSEKELCEILYGYIREGKLSRRHVTTNKHAAHTIAHTLSSVGWLCEDLRLRLMQESPSYRDGQLAWDHELRNWWLAREKAGG